VLAETRVADPARVSNTRAAGVRERLGVTVGEVTVLVTPLAVLAAGKVGKYLTTTAMGAGKAVLERLRRKATGAGRRPDEVVAWDLSSVRIYNRPNEGRNGRDRGSTAPMATDAIRWIPAQRP
jgi:hypothetical protein